MDRVRSISKPLRVATRKQTCIYMTLACSSTLAFKPHSTDTQVRAKFVTCMWSPAQNSLNCRSDILQGLTRLMARRSYQIGECAVRFAGLDAQGCFEQPLPQVSAAVSVAAGDQQVERQKDFTARFAQAS